MSELSFYFLCSLPPLISIFPAAVLIAAAHTIHPHHGAAPTLLLPGVVPILRRVLMAAAAAIPAVAEAAVTGNRRQYKLA